MIISHSNKFAFFRVPKTGSTSAEFVFRLSQVFDPSRDLMTSLSKGLPDTLPDNVKNKISDHMYKLVPELKESQVKGSYAALSAHITPALAVELGLVTVEQLREYKSYAFLRDPYDRFVSAYKHSASMRYIIPAMFQKTVEELNALKNSPSLIWKPQKDYFFVNGEKVVTPLNFSNFEQEIRNVLNRIGGIDFIEIPNMNPSIEQVGDLSTYDSPAAKAVVESLYVEDRELYNAMIEERIA